MTKRNIVHVEIPAADAQKAGEFYKALFDWEIEHVPEMNYTMWDPHEGPGGGFSPLGDDVKPGDVIIFVNSEDIEADLKKAASLGASIVTEKSEIPGIGWWGTFKDPTGNMISIYTSLSPEFNQ